MFQVPAILNKVTTLGDGGLRVIFDTQEITDPAQLSALFSMKGETLGHLLFKEGKILASEVPDEELIPEEKKSPAQRLRGVLFVRHQQLGSKEDFEVYYRKAIEHFISQIKEKLV